MRRIGRKRQAPTRFAPEDFVAAKQQRLATGLKSRAAPTTIPNLPAPQAAAATAGTAGMRPAPIKAKRRVVRPASGTAVVMGRGVGLAVGAVGKGYLLDNKTGADEFVGDARRLAEAFKRGADGYNKMKITRVEVLPLSPHATAYEALASAAASTQVPMLERSSAPGVRKVDAHSKPQGLMREVLGFHGTAFGNVAPIVRGGFLPGRNHGVHGPAVYTSTSSDYSNRYCDFQNTKNNKSKVKTMIGCRVLAHDNEIWDTMQAVIDPQRVLPVALIHYRALY
jgi:hypothetical protein